MKYSTRTALDQTRPWTFVARVHSEGVETKTRGTNAPQARQTYSIKDIGLHAGGRCTSREAISGRGKHRVLKRAQEPIQDDRYTRRAG